MIVWHLLGRAEQKYATKRLAMERGVHGPHTHTPVLMSASVGSISLLPYLTAKNKRKPESVQRERR